MLQPLEGVVVVDVSEWVAGPNCTKILADFGARVIKVERPGGDPARTMGPFPSDVANPEKSGIFLHLNTNKESVVVDIERSEGAEVVRQLAASADVFVESSRPGRLVSAGLAPEQLIADNPRLVVTSVTPFGQSGPYRDWEMTDIVAFAMGGMNVSGVADREPVKLIGNAVLMQSGVTASTATLGALYLARERGVGQHVDVATFETQNGSLDRRRYYLLSYEYSGVGADRTAVVGAGRPAVGGRFECADGKLITTGRVWPDHVGRMVRVLGDGELSALYETLGHDVMAEHPDLVNRLLAQWSAARPARAAMREAQAAGWPIVVVNDPKLLLEDDHLCARGFWVTATHPFAGDVVHTGAPWRVDGGGWALKTCAPTLGQHTDIVLREILGYSDKHIDELRVSGVVAWSTQQKPPFGPLDGVRVLDMTIALAGAFSTMLLADLGAEVIKVESLQHYPTPTKGLRNPPRGTDAASMSTARDYPDNEPYPDPWNRLSWFNSQARNKRDVTIDITRERGRELFLRLVERCDGMVENNGVGLLEKLGVGPDVLLGVNPRFVLVRMPPLGFSGPDCGATGFGWHFEDLGGFLRVQGYPEGPEVGSIFMDGASGPGGASAFLMGLLQRQVTGRGAVCELAQVENMICHIGDLTTDAAMNDRVPRRWGNRSPDFAPQGCYRCVGEDAWVVLSVRNGDEWRRLLGVLGSVPGSHSMLDRPELSALDGRHEAHDEIDAAVTDWTSRRTPMEAAKALQTAGIPAGPVLSEADAVSDPHLHERGFFHLLDHPSCGTHFHAGANFQMSRTPPVIWRAAPVLGQDNEYVYKQLLGVSDVEYERLTADGHVGTDYL